MDAGPMRIVAGGPTRDRTSAVFGLHMAGLDAQGDVVDCHREVRDIGGPKWHDAKIEAVAKCRQTFLDDRPDALFLVDDDLICGPGVLDRMLAVDADVVYGVFWSDWDGFDHRMPQVWDVHPYGHSAELVKALSGAEIVRSDFGFEMDAGAVREIDVLGGGACTLIRGRGFESRYWPLLESIRPLGGMWGGEDRTFNLGLECRGIRQVAVTGLPIVHLDTLAKQTPGALAEAKAMVGL